MLDDMSFSSTPDTLTMGGVAKPNDTSFSERNRTFTWKKTSVKKIAETIAGRYGLDFEFDGDDHDIDAKEQDATDSSFLQDLCDTYALVIKVYAAKLWVYVREVTEKTAEFEPRARVVRVDWLESDVVRGEVIPKVVYELV